MYALEIFTYDIYIIQVISDNLLFIS